MVPFASAASGVLSGVAIAIAASAVASAGLAFSELTTLLRLRGKRSAAVPEEGVYPGNDNGDSTATALGAGEASPSSVAPTEKMLVSASEGPMTELEVSFGLLGPRLRGVRRWPTEGSPGRPTAAEDSLSLIETYHAEGLAQSKTWFRFSLFFASLGFALIAVTVVNAVASGSKVAASDIVSLVGGGVVEAVSGLFFVQANRARALMAEFFDKLRADDARQRAEEIAEGIESIGVRSRLQAALALTLADTPDADRMLALIVRGADAAIDPKETTSGGHPLADGR